MALEFLAFRLDLLMSIVLGLEITSQITRVVLRSLAGTVGGGSRVRR